MAVLGADEWDMVNHTATVRMRRLFVPGRQSIRVRTMWHAGDGGEMTIRGFRWAGRLMDLNNDK
jgi:hypothetical protein